MHLHFADMHDAIDMGVSHRTYAKTVDGSGRPPATTKPVHTKKNADDSGDTPTTDATPTKDVKKGGQAGDGAAELTEAQQQKQAARTKKAEAAKQAEAGASALADKRAIEAIKNGQLNAAEVKYLQGDDKNHRGAAALTRVTAGLQDKVDPTLEVDGDGKRFADGSENNTRYNYLSSEMSLDELKQYSKADPEAAARLATRTSEENTMVGTIKDQLKLRGVLRLQQEKIKAGNPDFVAPEDLKQQIEDKLKSFDDLPNSIGLDLNDHGGSGWGNTDWEDGESDNMDLDRLLDMDKHDSTLLNQWVGRQGAGKYGGGGDTAADTDHGSAFGVIDDARKKLAAGDITQEDYDNAKARATSADEIVNLVRQYQSIDSTYGEAERKIGLIDESVGWEREVLSPGNNARIDAYLADKDTTQKGQKLHYSEEPTTAGVTTAESQSNGTDKGGKGGKGGDTTTPPSGGHPVNEDGTRIDATGETTPAQQRALTIAKAQKQGYLPAGDNVTFDKQGNAQYTVQPGDSYWTIAAGSSGAGQPVNEDLWRTTWATNAQAMGRGDMTSASSQLLNEGDRVAIQGRSYDELVKLLAAGQQQNQG